MSLTKLQICVRLTLTLTLLFALGCQPARDDKASAGRGRLARGNNGGQQFAPRAGSAGLGTNANKAWGEVISSAGDQAFWQELYYLDYPALSGLPADDQLGFVSSQSGQSTGVRFYGNAQPAMNSCAALNSGTAIFDKSSLLIRLEIFDDKTGQPLADGTTRPDIPIQIAAGQDDFVDAGGSMQNGQVYLYFSDSYGSIFMSGVVQGGTFSGVMGYSDSATGGQSRTLGNFSVPAGGFFRCN